MTTLVMDTDILVEQGYQAYTIDTHRDVQLSLTATKGDSSVFIAIDRCAKLKVRSFVSKDASLTILFWNRNQQEMVVDENHSVDENGYLHVAYSDVNGYGVTRDTYVALRQKNARAKISSSALVSSVNTTKMQVVNFAPRTFGEMENFAVVVKGGKLKMDAIGKMVKGAKHAENHQKSRAMCFEEGQSSTIIPQLLIDENDVQASHAMTIGTVEKEQMYYLQSRGLTASQAMALISTGYLLPITKVIDQESLQQELWEELQTKLEAM